MQVIEGDFVSVRLLMDHIADDPRHEDINYLANNAIGARQFADWALACVGFENNLTAVELLADVKIIVRDVTPLALKAALIGFALLAKAPS